MNPKNLLKKIKIKIKIWESAKRGKILVQIDIPFRELSYLARNIITVVIISLKRKLSHEAKNSLFVIC